MKYTLLAVAMLMACAEDEHAPFPGRSCDEDSGACDNANQRAVGSLPQALTTYSVNRTDQPIGINQNLALQTLQLLTAGYPAGLYAGNFHCFYPGSEQKWVCSSPGGNFVFQSKPIGTSRGWRSFEIIYPGIFGGTRFYASTDPTMPTPQAGYKWHFSTVAYSGLEDQGNGWVKGTTGGNPTGTFAGCF
jgi:hypothetical protein